MSVTRSHISRMLPAPVMKTSVEHGNGSNGDIISVIHKNLAAASGQARSIASSFKGANDLETGRRIWDFLKNEIRYRRDPDGRQDIRLPSRFVADATGDCKSYSLFTAAILYNLGIPFRFRYASYTSDPTPQHVYIVTQSGVIIDGVWNRFNAEKPYKHKKDYTMRISSLSGIGCSECSNLSGVDQVMIGGIGKLKIGSKFKKAASKAQDAIKKTAVVKKASQIQTKAKGTAVIKKASQIQSKVKDGGLIKQAAKIQDKAKGTKVIKTLSKLQSQVKDGGAKSVTLSVPRRAYRTLVALNWRGWATKLASNLPQARSIWSKAGGSWPELEKSINAGKSKKALFGSSSQQVRTVDGIGTPVLATIGAILTAAAPIILLFRNMTGDSGGSIDTPGSESVQTESNPLTDILDTVTDIFSNKGVRTDNDPGQRQTSADQETPQTSEQSTGSNTGLIWLGVAAAAIFLLKK